MSINYSFGDVDTHGATIRAQAASLEQEHQSIVRDVLAAGDFWGCLLYTSCSSVRQRWTRKTLPWTAIQRLTRPRQPQRPAKEPNPARNRSCLS